MIRIVQFLLSLAVSSARSRLALQLEVASLRHQLATYQTEGRKPKISDTDRLLWSLISKCWSGWRSAVYFVQPRTVVLWQKKRFRDYWRKLSQGSGCGRPTIDPELQQLIKRMWQANPTWGSPRIVLELRMLGIDVAKSTVERYKPRFRQPPSPTWKTFLKLHARELVSIDFFVVPTVAFNILFVFVVLAHDRRRIVYFNVTEHPTAQWTAQQLTEAFPFDSAPRYLIRDGDGAYGHRGRRRIRSLGIREIVTAPASPWQNAFAERVIGSIRRELLDHVVVSSERHLRRLISDYLDYYHPWRTHQSLAGDTPDRRPIRPANLPKVSEFPAVQGLHHYYLPEAA